MPIVDQNGESVYYLKGKKSTRGHRQAGMIRQKENGGMLDTLMGLAKASRKDFETNKVIICGKDGTTKLAMMEKVKTAKHHSDWRIYTYKPSYLGQKFAKDDEYLCCCNVEDLLLKEAQRLLSTTKRMQATISGSEALSGRGSRRGNGENRAQRGATSDTDTDTDTDSEMNFDTDLSIWALDNSRMNSHAGGRSSGQKSQGGLNSGSISLQEKETLLLSVLKRDDIMSARNGQRDPREQNQDTGEYMCSCPNKVYHFASVEKIESTRHSSIQHTRVLDYKELANNTGAYAADLLENAPEGFVYRVCKNNSDSYEVWRGFAKVDHGPESWNVMHDLWITKEPMRGGGPLGNKSKTTGAYNYDPSIEKEGKRKKSGVKPKTRPRASGRSNHGAAAGSTGNSRSMPSAHVHREYKTRAVQRDLNGKPFDFRKTPPQIVGIVRKTSPHFNIALNSENGKRPDVKYSNTLTRLGSDYMLEVVPGSDALGMILFCVAMDESLADDMKIAQAKIRSNKRKIREELGLKVEEADANDEADDEP